MLGDDEGLRREAGGTTEEAESLGVGFFVFVGWVEVEEVDAGWREALEERHGAAVFHGEGLRDVEGGEVCAEGFEGGRGVFGEEDVAGSAAEGFDADGAGAGIEIDEGGVGEARGEDVEEGFAEAVTGGAGGGAGWGDEDAGTVGAGDDAHVG